MTDELKPVPCGCGGEAKVISYLSRDYFQMVYYVRCVECGTETDDLYTEAEAVTAWNTAMSADHFREVTKMMDATDIRVGHKDLISRQEAIDAIENSEFGYTYEVDTALDVIKSLPSAEPERTAKVKVLYRDESVIFGHCECGQAVNTYGTYCHKCGARLEWE